MIFFHRKQIVRAAAALIVLALAGPDLRGVSTTTPATFTADFDNPPCSGTVGVYQGIDFTVAAQTGGVAWDCENPGLPGQAGNSVSWPAGTTSSTFKFTIPRVMTSIRAATTSGPGWMVISTDAGEHFTRYITSTFQTYLSGFTKLATIVTVSFPGKGRIELDNITYQLRNPAAIAISTGANVASAILDGTVAAASSSSVSLQSVSTGVKITLAPGATAPVCLPVTIYDSAGNTIGTLSLCVPSL